MNHEFVIVGHVNDFSPGAGKMVTVNGRHVAIFRLGNDLHAIDNLCLHRAGPLCEGHIVNAMLSVLPFIVPVRVVLPA